MTATPDRIKASDIVFPADAPPPAVTVKFDLDAVLYDIWRKLGECGTVNRNDQLAIAIRALIVAGVDTRPRIIGAAMSLGFDNRHVGAVLSRGGGAWSRGADGVYSLTSADSWAPSPWRATLLPSEPQRCDRNGNSYTVELLS